jgi:sulfur-oxidizing protein SoxY
MTPKPPKPPAPHRRRECLAQLAQGGLWAALLTCGLPRAASAAADPLELAFDATSLDRALQAMGEHQILSRDIVITLPDVAEDGAFVAISVGSALPGTSEISIVVEHNQNPLVVQFTLPEGTEPFVATRVKVAASGRVYAVVQADGKVYANYRELQVQRGGCA